MRHLPETKLVLTRRAAMVGALIAGGSALSIGARTAPEFAGQPLIPPDRDTIIHVVSDSLGDQVTETIYKMALDIAADRPGLGVIYYGWRTDQGAYAAPVELQKGTGRRLTLYNFAVGGSQPARLFGRDRTVALDPVDADIVIWQHGKNVSSEQSPDGRMQSAYEMYRLTNTHAVHVAILEPPNRDNDRMQAMNQTIERLAAEYGDMVVIDSYSPWIAAGKPARAYVDNLHPNAWGVDTLSRPAIRAQLASAQRPAQVTPARLSRQGPNILRNGAFTQFSADLPVGWTVAGRQVVIGRDTSEASPGRTSSLSLSQTAAGGCIRQLFDSEQMQAIAGHYLWFAALMRIDVDAAPTAGLMQLSVSDEIGQLNVGIQHTQDLRPGAEVGGRWAWCIGRTQRAIGHSIEPQKASLKIFVDLLSPSARIWLDRVVLGTGTIPHDMVV